MGDQPVGCDTVAGPCYDMLTLPLSDRSTVFTMNSGHIWTQWTHIYVEGQVCICVLSSQHLHKGALARVQKYNSTGQVYAALSKNIVTLFYVTPFQICHLCQTNLMMFPTGSCQNCAYKPWRYSTSEQCTTVLLTEKVREHSKNSILNRAAMCPHVTMLHCCMPPLLMPLVPQIQWCYDRIFPKLCKIK